MCVPVCVRMCVNYGLLHGLGGQEIHHASVKTLQALFLKPPLVRQRKCGRLFEVLGVDRTSAPSHEVHFFKTTPSEIM